MPSIPNARLGIVIHPYPDREGLPIVLTRLFLHSLRTAFSTFGVMKILVADDSAEMRRCVREVVAAADEIIECSSGLEAVAAFARHLPDWVLLDIEMPGQDGLSAARQIRAEFPNARIIFVTAFDERRLRAAAAQLGQGYVLKTNLEQINRIIT